MRGLARALGGLREALIASGQSGDSAQIVRDETRLLAREISNKVAPKDRKKLERVIQGDLKKHFMSMPKVPLRGDQRDGKEHEWLLVGPNFLYGARKEMMRLNASTPELRTLRKQKLPEQKATWLGIRPPQRVYEYNRFIVRKKQLTALAREQKARIGLLRATLAETAKELGDNRIPKWISKHFPTKRGVRNLTGLNNANNPSALFGSRSPGITSQRPVIAAAVKRRIKAIASRIRLILSGYNKDIRAGMKPRKRARETSRTE